MTTRFPEHRTAAGVLGRSQVHDAASFPVRIGFCKYRFHRERERGNGDTLLLVAAEVVKMDRAVGLCPVRGTPQAVTAQQSASVGVDYPGGSLVFPTLIGYLPPDQSPHG